MDTRNQIDLFNDDFADLFNEADMEIGEFEGSQESVSSLIRLLENERNIQKRLETIQNIILKFVPTTSIIDVDKKILQHLMPAIKTLLGDVVNEICQTLPRTTDSNEKSIETFNVLQEYLQVCLSILEVLNSILDYILKNEEIDLCYVRSIPWNLIKILHLTFQHCKDSAKLYKNYLDDLKEILLLFKGAQDIHTKLLKLLEERINVDNIMEEETVLVQNVLEILGEVSEVLIDMNIKALADNWKGYMSLTQKFANTLKKSSFKIDRPLALLTAEISRNLDNVLKMDANDLKGVNQILKICNFYVRIALKLCDTFWSNLDKICNGAFKFLEKVYSFYPPFLKYRGCAENIIEQIDSMVITCVDPLLNKLLYETEFFKTIDKVGGSEVKLHGFLFLLTSIFQRLPTILKSNRSLLMGYPISELLNLYFDVAQISYSNFFWKITQSTSSNQQSLYNSNVTNISLIVLLLNREQYKEVEIILFRNIIQDCIWCALSATDIWCSVLRQKNPRLTDETLCNVIEKTKPLFLHNFSNRSKTLFLETFMQRLYTRLLDKKTVIDKYPPCLLNLHIWKVLGFEDFPQEQTFMLESLLINIIEKIEGFASDHCTLDDFNLLCTGLETTSRFPKNISIDMKHVLLIIINLWNFDLNNSKDSTFFKRFISKLCLVTNHFILHLSNGHLLLVLTKLKQLLNTDINIKTYTAQILNSLAAKSFAQSPEQNQITSAMSELLRILLLDSNPLINQNALEVFVNVLNGTPHKVIIQNAVKNDKHLQRTISNFIQNIPLAKQTNEIEPNVIIKQPKINPEIHIIINRITSDVTHLHKLCNKEESAAKDVTEIVSILSQQLDCKF